MSCFICQPSVTLFFLVVLVFLWKIGQLENRYNWPSLLPDANCFQTAAFARQFNALPLLNREELISPVEFPLLHNSCAVAIGKPTGKVRDLTIALPLLSFTTFLSAEKQIRIASWNAHRKCISEDFFVEMLEKLQYPHVLLLQEAVFDNIQDIQSRMQLSYVLVSHFSTQGMFCWCNTPFFSLRNIQMPTAKSARAGGCSFLLKLAKRDCLVLNLHLKSGDCQPQRDKQMQAIVKAFQTGKSNSVAIILGGDFNQEDPVNSLNNFASKSKTKFICMKPLNTKRDDGSKPKAKHLDHILLSSGIISAITQWEDCDTIDLGHGDHLAVVLKLSEDDITLDSDRKNSSEKLLQMQKTIVANVEMLE